MSDLELFNQHPVPTWIFSTKTHRFLAVNEAMLKAYGYTRQQLLEMTIDQIRPSRTSSVSGGSSRSVRASIGRRRIGVTFEAMVWLSTLKSNRQLLSTKVRRPVWWLPETLLVIAIQLKSSIWR